MGNALLKLKHCGCLCCSDILYHEWRSVTAIREWDWKYNGRSYMKKDGLNIAIKEADVNLVCRCGENRIIHLEIAGNFEPIHVDNWGYRYTTRIEQIPIEGGMEKRITFKML
jgi:hypothetical protein